MHNLLDTKLVVLTPSGVGHARAWFGFGLSTSSGSSVQGLFCRTESYGWLYHLEYDCTYQICLLANGIGGSTALHTVLPSPVLNNML